MPMATILLSLVVGIIFSDALVLSPWVWLAVGVCALTLNLLRGYRSAVYVALFALGGGAHSLQAPDALPLGRPVELMLHIESDSRRQTTYHSTEASVVACEGHSCSARLRIFSDSTLRFNVGEVVCAKTVIKPFKGERERYADQMQRRGYVGYTHLNLNNLTPTTEPATTTLHTLATQSLRRLLPDDEARSVVLSMATGYRGETTPRLAQLYGRSGAAHLLAVSGLHVGIVYMLCNLLLLPLILLWRGNIYHSVAVVVVIWLYVALCDWSPSALRAAIMFSALQLSRHQLGSNASGNSICAAAAVMLALAPRLLFDIGFQLSFTAVASIVFWGRAILRPTRTPYRILNSLIDLVAIGVLVTLSTAPLTAHHFGFVAWVGIALNPILIPLANIIVFGAVVALLTPSPVAEIFASLAHTMAEVQNDIIEATMRLDVAAIEWSPSALTVGAIYVVAIVFTIVCFGFRWKRRYFLKDIS